MAKKPIPSIHVPIQTENGSMELAWYLYLKSTGEGGGGSTTVDWDDITDKPDFAVVATSGSYNDLSNKPTIPIVNNSTITFTQGGVTKGTITLNQSSSETIAFESGGGTDLPDQTGHSGDFLTTNGTSVSWGAAPVTSVNSKTGAVTLTASDVGALPDSTVIPAAQVNSDWNAGSGVAQILNKPTLGTAAAADTTDFATATQGGKADTAVQPGDLATVATSGSYSDLSNKPTIPAAQVNSDWNASSGVAQILNKPTLGTMSAESANDYTKTSGLAAVATSGAYSDLSGTPSLATVATSGSYNDLSNKPTIPTVNDATITFTQGGVTKGTITTNQSSASTIALDAGGGATVPQSIDAEIVGTLTITDNSIVSGFSKLNYLSLPGVFTLNDANSFEIKITFTTKSSVYSTQWIAISSKYNSGAGSCFMLSGGKVFVVLGSDIASQTVSGVTTLSASTKYYVKLSYDGARYTLSLSTDDVNYTQEAYVVATALPAPDTICFGQGVQGTDTPSVIHMDSCYIKKNGVIIWQGMDAPGLYQRVEKGHEVVAFQAPTSANSYKWYRKYADGWVEQGGECAAAYNGAAVTFPITMSNTRYHFFLSVGQGQLTGTVGSVVNNRMVTGMTVYTNYSGSQPDYICWEIKGMAA